MTFSMQVLGEEGTVVDVKDERRRIAAVRFSKITVRSMYMNLLTKVSVGVIHAFCLYWVHKLFINNVRIC